MRHHVVYLVVFPIHLFFLLRHLHSLGLKEVGCSQDILLLGSL